MSRKKGKQKLANQQEQPRRTATKNQILNTTPQDVNQSNPWVGQALLDALEQATSQPTTTTELSTGNSEPVTRTSSKPESPSSSSDLAEVPPWRRPHPVAPAQGAVQPLYFDPARPDTSQVSIPATNYTGNGYSYLPCYNPTVLPCANYGLYQQPVQSAQYQYSQSSVTQSHLGSASQGGIPPQRQHEAHTSTWWRGGNPMQTNVPPSLLSSPGRPGFAPPWQQQPAYTPYEPLRSVKNYHGAQGCRVDKQDRLYRGRSMVAPVTSKLTSPDIERVAQPSGQHTNLYVKNEQDIDRQVEGSNRASPWRATNTPPRTVKPLPVPVPTASYLDQSAKPPQNLSTPQPLLIVIDLNGTLLHRPNRKNSSSFVGRPFLRPFLNYLLENFSVLVWSSAWPENVSSMCRNLFTRAQRSQLVAEWGRDQLGLDAVQYRNKVQVYKHLSKVWSTPEIAATHPEYVRSDGVVKWDQSNTVLVDDSVLKASSEPFNLVQVPDFEGTQEQMKPNILRQVVGYLEELRHQKDVSSFIRGRSFMVDGGWDYAWTDTPDTKDSMKEKPEAQVLSETMGLSRHTLLEQFVRQEEEKERLDGKRHKGKHIDDSRRRSKAERDALEQANVERIGDKLAERAIPISPTSVVS